MRLVSHLVSRKRSTYINGNSRCERENKTSKGGIDRWREDRYKGRHTNDTS